MVKVTTEQLPESQVRVRVEVEPERVAKAVDRGYRKLANQMNIPGFRKGKAPRAMVERMVGPEALMQEGLDILLNDLYREALSETDIHPVAQPEVDLDPKATELKAGDPLTVTFTVSVMPETTLGDYHSVRVPVLAVTVTPEQVDESVQRIRERQAEWQPVERPLKEGDRATIDVLAQVGTYTQFYSPEGEPLVQGGEAKTLIDQKGVEREISKDSPLLLPGVVDQIVGMSAGQEKTFEISLPADAADAELSGKLSTWRVKVHDVKEKHLPEVDDEFAKSVGFESLEQMRDEIQKRAQDQANSEARRVYENSVIAKVVDEAETSLPAALVDHEIEHMIEERGEALKRQNIELDEYLRLTKKTKDELREELREQAIRSVKTTLVLTKIAEAEKLEVTPYEVEREIEIAVTVFGDQGAKIRQSLSRPEQRERLADRLLTRKVIDMLTGLASQPTESAEETPEEAAAAPAESAQPVEAAEASTAPANETPAAEETTEK